MKNVCIALLGLLFLTTSCIDDDDNNNIINGPSLLDRIEMSTEHTILTAALERTGLNVTLDNAGSFTIFAPTDVAFMQYLAANNFADINAVPIDVLRDLLQYHLLQELKRTTDFIPGYNKTSANNQAQQQNLDLYIQTTPTFLLNATVALTTENITARNGVLHVTDRVLELPTVATLMRASTDFSNLLAALNQQGLTPTLENTNTTGVNAAPFTVFAPSNTAIQALIDENITDSLNTIADVLALPNLNDVLLNHVVSGSSVRSENFSDGFMIDPITSGMLTINTTGGTVITDQQGRLITVVGTDITGINGVLHVIDNVLLP